MNWKLSVAASAKRVRGLTFFCSLVVAASCGFQKVEQPKNVQVDPVSSYEDLNLSLTAGEGVKVFNGALLVWKPETSRADVDAILRATRAYNEAYVSRLQAVKPFISDRLDPLDLEIKQLRASMVPLAAESQQRDRRAQLVAGGLWFENEVSALSERLGESFDAGHAQDLFARYCDGKLWELGMKPLLADGTYSVRPTTTPLCEKHYQGRGYFTATECLEPQPDSAGAESFKQNYFSCVWKTLKQTSYVTEGPLNSEIHAPVLDALAVSQEFRIWVANGGSGSSFCGLLSSSKLRLFAQFAVPQPTPCVVPGTNVTLTLNVPTAIVSLAQASAATVVDAIERLEDFVKISDQTMIKNAPAELQFVRAAAVPRAGRTLSEAELASDELARKLRVMGFGKAKCGNQKFSLADLSFNLPFGQFEVVSPSLDSCTGLPSTADFPEIFVQDPALAELETKLLERQQQRKTLVADACNEECSTPLAATRCAYTASRQQQAAVSDARAIVFPGFELQLKPVLLPSSESSAAGLVGQTGIVEVSVALSKNIIAVGCYSDLENGKAIECPSEAGEGGASSLAVEKMHVEFKRDTKGLRVEIPVTDRLLSRIDEEKKLAFLSGSNLVAELYANALGGLFPYLSGSIAFQSNVDGATEIKGRGVASYLMQHTDLVVRETQICQVSAN